MTRRSLIAGLLVLLGLFAGSGLWAISVRPANLQEIVGAADRIFYGECVEVREEDDAGSGFPVTVYRFAVVEGLKGVEAGDTVEFRQVSSTSRRLRVPGLPSYRKGQSLLIFLGADSRLGLTSPVGLDQGIFFPERLQTGELGFRNAFQNQNLSYEMERSAMAAAALVTPELDYLTNGQPIPLAIFKTLVAKLDVSAKQGEVR